MDDGAAAATQHVEVEEEDPAGDAGQHCIAAYFAELAARFEDGFDPGTTRPVDVDDLRPPAGALLVARLRGEAVGCVGIRYKDGAAELKRMWVHGSVRGHGVGRRLLVAAEEHAAARGCERVRLDTNRALTEAIALYRSAGYDEVPPFNDEPYAHHWFEKGIGV